MSDKLRIFVSGKEGELDDERAVIIDLITSVGFFAVGSENRSASSESVETEFLGEVETSDIYIGVFGKMYSDPTINEFNTARDIGIDTLVFEKDVENEERDDKLKTFLLKIKEPKSGLYVPKYKNVIDLRNKIIDALSYSLTKKFKSAQELRREKNKKTNENIINSVKDSEKNTILIEKMKKFPFVIQFSENFDKSQFTDFRIISTIKKGERHMVTAKIKGSTKNGFLDLAIKDPDGIWLWFPDPQSYDSPSDNGNLCFENGIYEKQWEFSLPDKSGRYLAVMGLYENIFANREIVNYELQEFTID